MTLITCVDSYNHPQNQHITVPLAPRTSLVLTLSPPTPWRPFPVLHPYGFPFSRSRKQIAQPCRLRSGPQRGASECPPCRFGYQVFFSLSLSPRYSQTCVFTQPTGEGHWGGFQFGVILSQTITNMWPQDFVQTHVFIPLG